MRLKLARRITPDEIRTYDHAGVVCLRGVLDLATVNLIRACIDDGVRTIGASQMGYDLTGLVAASNAGQAERLNDSSAGQHDVSAIAEYIKHSGKQILLDQVGEPSGSFLLDTALASRHERFRQLIMRGPLSEIAGALLQSERVRYYHDQLFVKEPRTEQRTAFHQDAGYMNIDGDDCCVLWVPVDPVTAENGAMQYVRSSHLDRKYFAPNVFVSQTLLPGAEGEPVPDVEGHPEDFDIVHFDTEPGDILVHHYRTLHGAGGNKSRYQVRRAASIRYTGDDIRFKSRPGAPAQLQLKEQLNEGDRLCDADFPVVWRRPTNHSEHLGPSV